MTMRIRAYTLIVHAGHAPCWMFDPQQRRELLSLANCKPLIRDAALLGEWIAGVTPKAMGCRLAYLMKVGERLTRMEYWARYQRSRHDSIYKPLARGGWRQLKNPWHVDEKSERDDLRPFSVARWLYGALPRGMRISPYITPKVNLTGTEAVPEVCRRELRCSRIAIAPRQSL